MGTNWHELRDLGNERHRAAIAEARDRTRSGGGARAAEVGIRTVARALASLAAWAAPERSATTTTTVGAARAAEASRA